MEPPKALNGAVKFHSQLTTTIKVLVFRIQLPSAVVLNQK